MDTGAKGGNRMLKDLVKANRSYRGYDEGRCVTKEELLEMADCARLAASSVNRQPLQYYLACGRMRWINRKSTDREWAEGLPELTSTSAYGPTPLLSARYKRGEVAGTVQRDVGIAAQIHSARGDRAARLAIWRRQRNFASGISHRAHRGNRKKPSGRARRLRWRSVIPGRHARKRKLADVVLDRSISDSSKENV